MKISATILTILAVLCLGGVALAAEELLGAGATFPSRSTPRCSMCLQPDRQQGELPGTGSGGGIQQILGKPSTSAAPTPS